MAVQRSKTAYPAEPIVALGELPNPFIPPGGSDVVSREEEWPACARKWRDMIIDIEYGGMPPEPDSIDVETLCHNTRRRLSAGPRNWTYRVHCCGGQRPFSFCVRIVFPSTSGQFPAIIRGDGCWWHPSDEIVERAIENGCALVMFSRTEMAEDLGYSGVPNAKKRSGGLYDVYPDQRFGALSAWAWGYHRCVDFLYTLPFIDTDCIAATGHSRGGKTALVAGATDERITLVNDNASCAGGSAAFRYVGDGGETLNIINVFPSWFGTGLQPYLGREGDIPFDQHCLLASIAPRPLLLTYALDDRWSNPEGMVQCAWAAKEVYRFLGAADSLAFHLREGGHAHPLEDWEVLFDFIAWKSLGRKPEVIYNSHPYEHLKPAFSWKAPDSQAEATVQGTEQEGDT